MGKIEIKQFSFADGVCYVSFSCPSATEAMGVVYSLVQADPPVIGSSPPVQEAPPVVVNVATHVVSNEANKAPVVENKPTESTTAEPPKRRGRPPKSDSPAQFIAELTEKPVERFTVPGLVESPVAAPANIPTKQPQTPPQTPPPVAEANGSAGGVDQAQVPPELMQAQSFMQVMRWFISNGYTTQETVKAQCDLYHAHVPVLQRLAGDISDRINRALTALVAAPN